MPPNSSRLGSEIASWQPRIPFSYWIKVPENIDNHYKICFLSRMEVRIKDILVETQQQGQFSLPSLQSG